MHQNRARSSQNTDEDGNNSSPRPPTSSPAGSLSNIHSQQQQQQQEQRNRRRARQLPQTFEQEEQQGMIIDEEGSEVRKVFQKFLNEFTDEQGQKYYIDQLDAMEEDESTTLMVDWLHLRPENTNLESKYQQLADVIQTDYYRFEPYLRQSVQNFVRDHKPNYVTNADDNVGENKEFYITITNFTDRSTLRELNTSKIGQLCSFSATVTRTTEVRPELIYGTFQCPECGLTIKNITQQFKYTEPKRCLNNDCQNTKSFRLLVDRSKFVDWQKARGQENSHDIPPGSMPRSIDVILRNETVERTKPGDNSTFTGTLIVVPDISSYYSKTPMMIRGSQNQQSNQSGTNGITGLRALGVRELNYKLVFLANNVTLTHKQFGNTNDIRDDNNDNDKDDEYDINQELTKSEQEDLLKMKDDPKLYERLSNSIAPNIYGHSEIKRGIMLMLFGGVKKSTKDGVKLRGDINICVVGDPSCAKSQFLKFVTRILPRTVYTSGKASSAAGLTAAVMRDPETGEFGIEAGALMLADNGICCIDEFDKMDQIDQAAIHEAMEQQTITITKAGIQATLNARASILAAANPMWGRYDKSKPLRYNVNISPPIMSRFDLFFVILDECDETTDFHVAQHIVNLHRYGPSTGLQPDYTVEQLQRYVRFARKYKPKITPESHVLLVRYYRQLRQRDQSEQKAYRITVRQLESLIRLSEALARLHFDHEVTPRYVKEAGRLLSKSIISVEEPDVELFGGDDGTEAPPLVAPKGDETTETTDTDQASKEIEQMSIGYNYYIQTANLIVYHIRRNEEEDQSGLKQNDLENIIMKEKAEICDDNDEFAREHKILRFIIHRLISVDHILLIKQDDEKDENRILMVHPNYDPDSRNTRNLQTQNQTDIREQKESESFGDGDGDGDVSREASESIDAVMDEAGAKRKSKNKSKSKSKRNQKSEDTADVETNGTPLRRSARKAARKYKQ